MSQAAFKILIVDDDRAVSELLRRALQAPDLEICVRNDAEGLIEDVAKARYDLILLDRRLPNADGVAVLRDLRHRFVDTDVILMSAYTDLESVLVAVGEGAYDFLVKPFRSIQEVARRVRRALDKRKIWLENRRLIAYLTQANQQIEEMNRVLESQVKERTQQLEAANDRLTQLTVTDDVTGLYNQRFLYPRLEEEIQRQIRYQTGLAVIMLDIDHFKGVNDTRDHIFGSRVLRRIGATLQKELRDIDMVVRYGGDEFVVLLPHTGRDEAAQVAERLRWALEHADVGDESDPYRLTASLGVSAVDDTEASEPPSAAALLRRADLAMYAAKKAGRNRVGVAQDANTVGDDRFVVAQNGAEGSS